MIDCRVEYGAFVPIIPDIYTREAVHGPQQEDASSAGTDASGQEASNQNNARASDCAIGPTWTELTLISIERYNHDTSLFEFALPDPNSLLRLPVTAHLLVKTPSDSYCTVQSNVNCLQDDNGSNSDLEHVRPYTAIEERHPGRFKIMVKRYREWGTPESVLKQQFKIFLFTKTDHSYKPPGRVSSYIHSLQIGQTLSFKHNSICLGKVAYPFDENISAITMIAVGAGVAPMIRILRALLDGETDHDKCLHVKKIRLLYGARTVADILQREQLDQWHESNGDDRFQVCYCIGSRWSNVHFAAKTSQKQGPPLPQGWESVPLDRKELGWVDGDKVVRKGASNAQDRGHRIFICGLPGVYLSLCGKRSDPEVEEGTQLHRLGYTAE